MTGEGRKELSTAREQAIDLLQRITGRYAVGMFVSPHTLSFC